MDQAGRIDRDRDLALCVDAAQEAGRIAMSFFRKDPKVWYKGGTSPVSEADYAVNSYLREFLGKERPGYGWVSEESADGAIEESGPPRADGLASAPFFVVDPIDGTRAYLRGEATWCISIALVADERPVVGVIFAPVFNETFKVTRGGDAHLNGAPIKVRAYGAEPDPAPMEFSMPDSFRGAFKGVDKALSDGITGTIGVPSLAYRLALVACGRLDATLIRPSAADWDIAAGDLLLEMAGGRLVDASGRQTLYRRARNRHGLLVAASRDAEERAIALAAALSR